MRKLLNDEGQIVVMDNVLQDGDEWPDEFCQSFREEKAFLNFFKESGLEIVYEEKWEPAGIELDVPVKIWVIKPLNYDHNKPTEDQNEVVISTEKEFLSKEEDMAAVALSKAKSQPPSKKNILAKRIQSF